jgi:DNA-binding MarR family transcriptional regulator
MNSKKDQLYKLRAHMQRIMRAFPSSSLETPCGVKLSTSNAHVLLAIYQANGIQHNPQILAKDLGLNKSSIARICTALEEKGFIRIEINLDDKRNNLILITAKGLKWSEKLKVQGDQYFSSVLEKIPKNKINELLNSLETLTRTIERSSEQGSN